MNKKRKKPLCLYIIGTKKWVDKLEDLGKDPKNPAYIVPFTLEDMTKEIDNIENLNELWQYGVTKIVNKLYPELKEKLNKKK